MNFSRRCDSIFESQVVWSLANARITSWLGRENGHPSSMTSSPFHFGQVCQTVKEHSGQKLIQTWRCHSIDDLENKWVVETLKYYQHFFGWYWENLNLGMPAWMTCWGWRMTCLRESGKQQQVLRWLCTLPPYFVVYCTSTNSSTFWYTLWWRWGMA